MLWFAALLLASIAPLISGTRVVLSGLFHELYSDFTPKGSQHHEGTFDSSQHSRAASTTRSPSSISIASDLGDAAKSIKGASSAAHVPKATSIQGASSTRRDASTTSAETKPTCKQDDKGLAVGCHLNCQCGWGQQCYPKWWPSEDPLSSHPSKQASTRRENRGVCQLAMPVLALASFFIFSIVLTAFVGVRTFLQWRALEDDLDAQCFIKTLSSNASRSFAHVDKKSSLSGVLKKSAPRSGATAETDSEDSDARDDAPDRAKSEASSMWQGQMRQQPGPFSLVEGPIAAAAACDQASDLPDPLPQQVLADAPLFRGGSLEDADTS